jgi:hypothetical protein
MRVQASRELLAAREDVWGFLAEPYHLAAGARWRVVAAREPTLFRKPGAVGTLVVTAADRPRLFAFHLVDDRLDVRAELAALAADRTAVVVTVEGPWLLAFRRTLARRAVNRLYGLCQTAAAI